MQTLTVYYVGSADENYESTPDESSADESTPDDVGRLINTDVDEPGDLREWLGDKLEQQRSLLESRPENTFEGVQITVSRDADVKSLINEYDRDHTIIVVKSDSPADGRLADWPQAKPVAQVAIGEDSATFVAGGATRWDNIILGLARQWIRSCR